MSKLHLKKGDNVVVISGKDKGKKGKVLEAMPKTGKVVVEGVNVVIRHTKPRAAGQTGGRIEKLAAFDASNAMIVCGKCNKATRVAHQIKDEKKVRICKKCGASID